MHTSGASDEFSELPTTPEYDQALINKNDDFLHPIQVTASFQHVIQRKCPTTYPKDNVEEEIEVHQEQVYNIPQDRIICSSSYSPVLPHCSRILTRVAGTGDPKPKLEVSENHSLHSARDTPNIRYANEGKDKVHS